MHDGQPLKKSKWINVIAPLSGAVTLAAGLTILLGWWFDIAIMRSLLPGFAPASATAAACMVLAGISQLTLSIQSASRWLIRTSQLFAINLILFGLGTELSLAAGWQELFAHPWQTSVGAGFAFFVAGLALLSGNWRFSSGLTPSMWLGWVVMVLGALSLTNQFLTGGVIIRAYSETQAHFIIAVPIPLIFIGLGLAIPSSIRQSYLSQYDGKATQLEQSVYALLCLTLTVMLSMFLALLLSSVESSNRNQNLLQALETEITLDRIIENSEQIRNESRYHFSGKGSPEQIERALQAQNRLEIAAVQLRITLALKGFSTTKQTTHLGEIEQGTRMLRESMQRLAVSDTSRESDHIEVLVTGLVTHARDLKGQILAFRSSSLDRNRYSSNWLFFVAIGGLLSVLPVSVLSLLILRRGFVAVSRANNKILQANETLETEIATRTVALIESERNHRSLLDNLPGVAFRIVGNKQFTCEYVSARIQEFLGVTPDEVTSGRLSFTELIHPDDLRRYTERVREVYSGRSVSLQYRLIRPDGSMLWVSTLINPSHMVDGVAQVFEGYTIDISDRKRADIRREVQTEVLVSLSSGAALQTTLDIVTRAVEEQCAGALCSILLVDESGEFLHYGSAPSLPKSYRLATDGLEIGPLAGSCGTAAFRRERVIVEDIQTDPLWNEYKGLAAAADLYSCWSEPISGNDGEILGTFATYQREPGPPSDESIEAVEWASYLGGKAIEHARSLQEQAARTAKDKADLAKSRFLATMSHEIRTPLNGVLGMVELMLNSTQSPLQIKQMKSAIKESSDLLVQVVDDIIEYSMSESGELKLDTKAVDLSELMHTVVDSQTPKARENDVQISVACGPSIPSWVLADGLRLRQILAHLLDNAIKFSGRKAGLKGLVELSIESRGCEAGMARVYLHISDDGIGMSPEDVQRLNQPFSQADISTTRAFGGTGMGLAFTTSLLQLMDSKLDFTCTVGRGLQVGFELLLPICSNHQTPSPGLPSPETPRPPPSIADAEASGRLILLAEDNHINQRVIVLQLQTLGYTTEVAENGVEALAMWKSGRYSLLLSDFHMPEMDGFDLVRQIRKLEKGTAEHTPIIGITASTVPSEIELSTTVGMDDCLCKPVPLKTMQEKLQQWLPLDTQNE